MQNKKIESMPISDNEEYRFEYNMKQGIMLEFKRTHGKQYERRGKIFITYLHFLENKIKSIILTRKYIEQQYCTVRDNILTNDQSQDAYAIMIT